MANPDLSILCIRRTDLGDLASGFHRGAQALLAVLPGHGLFLPRSEVEHDPSYKQVVPYVVVRRGVEVLMYRRSPAGGEERLRQQWSIGVGGHVEAQDISTAYPKNHRVAVERAARREVREETGIEIDLVGLGLAGPRRHLLLGLVNDEETDVGRCHVGIVYELDVGQAEVKYGPELHSAAFLLPERIEAGQLENWSRFVLEGYILADVPR
jgi:predicted NUDIX family phosphoesterase